MYRISINAQFCLIPQSSFLYATQILTQFSSLNDLNIQPIVTLLHRLLFLYDNLSTYVALLVTENFIA